MKRKLRIAVALVLSTALLAGCSNVSVGVNDNREEQTKSSAIEEKTVPLYMEDAEHKEEISLYFIDGSEVPYISAETVMRFLQQLNGSVSYDLQYDGEHAVITREGTKLTCDFDFENDTITFFDFDAFLRGNVGPIVNVGIPETGAAAPLFKEVETFSLDRYGKVMTYDLKPYEISMVHVGEGYYVPLQTISDLILTYYVAFTLYNGETVILAPGGLDDDLAEIYYSATGTRTEELAKFDYNELCFALDHEYGLKEIHNITSFDDFFFECGVRNKLMGTDQTEADIALKQVLDCQIDDLHSGFLNTSYMSDEETFNTRTADMIGAWFFRYKDTADFFYDARYEAFPEGVPPYEEIGDTT